MPDADEDVALCASCGAPLLKRTDEDGRTWLKCTGEHGWMRAPFLDADNDTEEWRSRRHDEMARIRLVVEKRLGDRTTNFNGFMQEDHFVTMGDGQAVVVAIGALQEDDGGDTIAHIAAKLGWSIDRTLDGLSHGFERGLLIREEYEPDGD